VNAALVPLRGHLVDLLLDYGGLLLVPTFVSIIIGAIVCGLGTSIFSAQDQNSVDMTLKKALFCMMVSKYFIF